MTRAHRMSRGVGPACGAVLALALSLAFPPGAAEARKAARPAPAPAKPSAALEEVSLEFESSSLLSRADQLAGLEQLDGRVASLLRSDLGSEERRAALFLSAAVRSRRGDHEGAADAYRRALDAADDGPFADDAAFAAIEEMEAAGHDDEAAREWVKWEKKYPKSPLLHEARLAQAWNRMRRGDAAGATAQLASLATAAPWMQNDPRVSLARATAAWLGNRPAEALTLLGPKPAGARALYLQGLCFAATGSLLKSAAAFQEVAERWSDSPLRDWALLGKADAFLTAHDDRSAALEFRRVAERVTDPVVKAEAELRAAGAVFLTGNADSALALLRDVVSAHAGTEVAARAQFLVGEALVAEGRQSEAIVEYNRVLTTYFQHKVAASAQYRVARCLDAMGRGSDATGSYQAVVRGYPLEPEAPAAAYLAGVGLLRQGKPLAAAPYFQLVLDRYAAQRDRAGLVVFAAPEHQELVEAALCLVEMCWHKAGDLGQLSGAPHLLLQKLPPSHSPWRAWAMLIDADAAAAQARYPEAQTALESLMRDFGDQRVGLSASKLLAWTYARQGRDSLAIATEERLVARWAGRGDPSILSGSFLDIAHERFNQKRYRDAAAAYEDFLRRFPGDPRRQQALYQAGLCYLRFDHAGDAVDRWEAIVRDSASSPIAERAYARAGDLYFQAERYDDARRCYRGLLEHFAGSSAASIATLRLAQCEYNSGHDDKALELYSVTQERFPGTPAAREAKRGTELSLYRLSQSANGQQVLAKLVEQFPNSAFAADAQFQIARRAYQEKRWSQAAEGFRRVVSGFPSYSAADQAQFLMADALAQSKQPGDARLAYEQFLSYFPASELRPTVQFRLGLLSFEAKDYMQAAVAFTASLTDSAPNDVSSAARYNLALCQRLLGRADDARAELERYRSLHPGDARAADVAFQLGDLNDAAGQPREAAAEFERALASRPKAALATEASFRLGRCREQLGDTDGALHAYQDAAASTDRDGPFRLSALARCAALYEGRRQFTKALEAYRDIARNSRDRELVAAAEDRASQIESKRGK